MSEVQGLLKKWIDYRFGDELSDVQERLTAYRTLVPGVLPDDYAEGLLFIRTAAGLHHNEVVSIELPRPRIPGLFTYIGPNPPIDVFFGLQRSHSNVFEELPDTGYIFPPSLVSIGHDGCGNFICLDVSAEGNGRIYHWWAQGDRTPANDAGEPGWGNVFLLAHSFTDLLRRMRPAPELDDNAPVGRVCHSRL